MARWLAILLSWIGMSAAALAADGASMPAPENPQVVVCVYNKAQLPLKTVLEGEKEARRVFDRAGVGVAWVTGQRGERDVPVRRDATRHLTLTIIPRAITLSDNTLGVAFLGSDGNGRYADVFSDRVRSLATVGSDVSDAQILGYVMAHEMGHLLLGSNAHSTAGIMQPQWTSPELRSISMARLAFTAAEGRQMRTRLSQVTVTKTSLAGSSRAGLWNR